MDRLFLDTSYVIALSVSKDHNHIKACRIADFLEKNTLKIITTRAVVLETGNSLSGLKYRQAAVELLEALEKDEKDPDKKNQNFNRFSSASFHLFFSTFLFI